MKRLLMIGLLILLAACGKDLVIHEDVNKDLATDTMQVVEILEKLAKDQKEPSEKQQAVFDEYINKYSYQNEKDTLDGINKTIYEYTEGIMTYHLDRVINLDSGADYVKDLRTVITHYIENGETILETHKASK